MIKFLERREYNIIELNLPLVHFMLTMFGDSVKPTAIQACESPCM